MRGGEALRAKFNATKDEMKNDVLPSIEELKPLKLYGWGFTAEEQQIILKWHQQVSKRAGVDLKMLDYDGSAGAEEGAIVPLSIGAVGAAAAEAGEVCGIKGAAAKKSIAKAEENNTEKVLDTSSRV